MLRSNFHLPVKQTTILILTILLSGVFSGCSGKNEKEYQRNLTLFKQNAASEANVVKWKSEVDESRAAEVSALAALDAVRKR